jgi:hypothetical protein
MAVHTRNSLTKVTISVASVHAGARDSCMVFTAIAVVFISLVEILRLVVDRAYRDHRHMIDAATLNVLLGVSREVSLASLHRSWRLSRRAR